MHKSKRQKHTNIQKLKLRQLKTRDFFSLFLRFFFSLRFKIHILTSCRRFTYSRNLDSSKKKHSFKSVQLSWL